MGRTVRLSAALGSLWLVALSPLANGQGLGLDLTKPEPAPPPKPAPTPAASRPVESTTKKPPENIALERDITQEDRVKSIQRKVYLKRHRFELAPSMGFTINDPYYLKYGPSIRGAFYLADTLAIAVRGSYFQLLPSDDVRTAKRTFHSAIYYSVPQWSALVDAEWSPIYGKVSIFNSILHFDAFVLGGLGGVWSETSVLPGRGMDPAADIGAGLRFVVKDYLAINLSAINTSYVDLPVGTIKNATQNMLILNAGLSIFFPFSSTGREAE